MKLIRNMLLAVGVLIALAMPAAAQSGCSAITNRAILTTEQWNNTCFGSKGEYPLNLSTSGNTTGTMPTARLPAFGSGDVSFGAAGGAGTIANNAVTNAKAAQAPANTMKGNWTGSTANEADNAMPTCTDTGNQHLNYVAGTGVTCGSAIGAFSAALGTVTAASTTNLATSGSTVQTITGNTAINSFGTGANLYRIVKFTGTPLITASSVIVTPTTASIQACPGDVATLVSDASGTPIWTIISYAPAGAPQTANVTGSGVSTSAATIATVSVTCGKWTLTATAQENGSGAPSNDYFKAAISGTTNSFTGTVNGKTRVYGANALSGISTPEGSAAIGPVDFTNTGTTSYFLVVSARTNPDTFDGSIRAVRGY